MEKITHYHSDQEILRMAERKGAEDIAAFFRKLFAPREKEIIVPGNVLPID